MTREEFLQELEQKLRGQVSDQELEDSLAYYRSYFKEQEDMGYTSTETIQHLGSASMIAKSIIEAHGENPEEEERQREERSYEDDSYSQRAFGNHTPEFGWKGQLKAFGIIALVVLVLILFAVFLIGMLPYILILLAIVFLVNYFRGR
ncbi:MAG: hypothetical protein U0K57_05300 [Lachnospiraceae bacterium]|nr:hypothetical protein [Lachnospiraceae bacterium]